MKAITFGEWLSTWYNTYKIPYLQPTSLRNIEQMIRLHTPQWLKDIVMVKITPLDCDRALANLPAGRTRKYARQVWYSAFLKAYKLGIVPRNILEVVDNMKYIKQRGKALTLGEQRQFIANLEGKRTKWLMLFYLHTGVRRTEALTLAWSDIDESENLILIKGTKTTDSYRHIVLTDDIKHILEEQKAQNERERHQTKRGNYHKAPESQVFPFTPQQVSRYFKALCPNHKLHDLRHTFITRCAESGVNVTVCQQLVGHSTANMTLNVYMHVMDEFKRKEALKYTIYPNFGQN